MRAARVALAAWLFTFAGAPGTSRADEPPPVPVRVTVEPEDERQSLRERLTEREDKRRPRQPFAIEVAGRPLTLGGEWEVEPTGVRRFEQGGSSSQADRAVLAQELELESFYSFGEPLSLFAQVRFGMAEELLAQVEDDVSDVFVERGELWIASEDVRESGLSFDAGRLHFEDERRWWWDADLDAARIHLERGDVALAFAVSRELLPERSDEERVDPEEERVLRLLGEASWEWREEHQLALFALHADDRSPTERLDEIVRRDREDPVDARLTWVGARASGAIELGARGVLGYWLDLAGVHGAEREVEYEEIAGGRSRSAVVGRSRSDVRGWAIDGGLDWLLALPHEPRVFAGLAVGSGDSDRGAGTDRAFRQTGLATNEPGYGGVERFSHYGILLDPELSNLAVTTLGFGIALLRSSSLDLVHHHYVQRDAAPELRDSFLDVTPTGRSRTLGDELDLVLAIEEWERLELELAAAAFRPGPAFGDDRGRLSYGGFFALRFGF